MLKKRTMRLATWNVQGIRNKKTEIFEELKKMAIDICVLTETKKKGKGDEKVGDYIHIHSGVDKTSRAKRGVSIAVHKELRKNIKGWEQIDEQIMTLEIYKNGHNIVVIGVYAPGDDANTIIKDKFYDQLLHVLSSIKNDKEIYLLGDLNGRVGKEDSNTVVGKYGETIINDNGRRLRDTCEIMSLKIMNGFFEHKDQHRYTWVQPTKGLRSIIDYVIQRQHSSLHTTDVRAFRGPECGSDHYLVMAKIIVHYRKRKSDMVTQEQNTNDTLNTYRYNIESLRHDSTKFLYKLRLANKMKDLEAQTMTAEEIYQYIKRCIHDAAKEAVGVEGKSKKQMPEWWSDEIGKLVDSKKKAYQRWLNTQDNIDRQVYARCNREVKREVTRSKNELWEKKCEEVDRCMGGTKVSQAWDTIKSLRKEGKQTNIVQLISNNEWIEHYKTLLTENRTEFYRNEDFIDLAERDDIHEITVEEIKKTLQKTKNGKAAGPGNIPIELVKYGPEILIENLAKIFNKCMLQGQDIPEDWNVAYISSIFKKGDKRQCQNYRGISVTNAMGRLYCKVIKNRIEAEFEDFEEQSGFRTGRSCLDNIFVLQQLIEKRKDRNLSTHLIFVDLEKAYDTVPIKKLFKTMTKVGLSGIYVRAIWNLYKNAKSAVKLGNSTSIPFPVTKGLKQGCCLSPTLFKIYIQEALAEWRKKVTGMGIEIGENCLATMLFADDQVIVANDENDIDYMLRKLVDEYTKWGLTMNMKKTEYLRIGEETNDPDLQVNKQIKRCNEYKYLGSIISDEGTSGKDVKYRIKQGYNSIRIMNSLLWSNQICLKTKMTIYKSVVEPIMTYGSECWQLTKKYKKSIETVEMDFLRRACKISRLQHIPNEEIRRRTGRVCTSTERIETRQLIWYGHVMRMPEERWPKRVLEYIPNRRRRRGRPPLSWMHGIEATMADRAIKENDWMDRKGWRDKCGRRQRP